MHPSTPVCCHPCPQVAFVDADMVFIAQPDAIFAALTLVAGIKQGVLSFAPRQSAWVCQRNSINATTTTPRCGRLEFVADLSVRPRCHLLGWQASLFVASTSASRASRILERASSGDFSRFTNTEQDVLDAEFWPPQCHPNGHRIGGHSPAVGTASASKHLASPDHTSTGGQRQRWEYSGRHDSSGCSRVAFFQAGYVSRLVVHHRLKSDKSARRLAAGMCQLPGQLPTAAGCLGAESSRRQRQKVIGLVEQVRAQRWDTQEEVYKQVS